MYTSKKYLNIVLTFISIDLTYLPVPLFNMWTLNDFNSYRPKPHKQFVCNQEQDFLLISALLCL